MSAPAQFKLKQRKRAVIIKHEPENFRDQLLEIFPKDASQLAQLTQVLDENDAELDYKRYGIELFEIVFVGGLIAPGGIIESGPNENVFRITACKEDKDVEAIVKILGKLIRRLKYLQLKLKDCLDHILQYINKFEKKEAHNIAVAVALFALQQLIPLAIIGSTLKEHLLKLGLPLDFLTTVVKVYIAQRGVDYMASSLRKAGLDAHLLEFFPPEKQTEQELLKHFADTPGFVSYYQQRQRFVLKETLTNAFYEKLDNTTPQDIVKFAQAEMNKNKWGADEIAIMFFNSLLLAFEAQGNKLEIYETQLVALLTKWGDVLSTFCVNAKAEMELMQSVQKVCYSEPNLMKHFTVIVKTLYEEAAVSKGAILYWYSKGAAPDGKAYFLTLMETYVNWLKEQPDTESDDEDEE